MPKLLRIPDRAALPEGPVRDFVELLFDYHQIAQHPSMEAICDQIEERPEDERAGTASRETIRRMFHGKVPRHWETVEVVFVALCQLAGVNPDRKVEYWDAAMEENVRADRRSQMQEVWSAALYQRPVGRAPFRGVNFDYEAPPPVQPAPRSTYPRFPDPWDTAPPTGWSAEPPF